MERRACLTGLHPFHVSSVGASGYSHGDGPPPGDGPQLPPPVRFDGTSLHTLRRISEEECLKVDLIDRLMDGYARLLILHHRRGS